MTDNFQELVRGIAEFKLIPFLGAGMSKPFGLPNWDGLMDELCKRCSVPRTKDVFEDAQKCEEAVGRAVLASHLESILKIDPNIPEEKFTGTYRILSLSPPIIYTTNYDGAVEMAAERAGISYRKVVGISDLREAPHDAKLVVKYHGDVGFPDSIVLTKGDYESRMSIESALDIRLRADLLGKGIVFLGYGFGDPNVELIWTRHKNLYGEENLPACFLVAFGSNPEKEAKLSELGIKVLTVNDAEEFSHLLEQLQTQVFSRNAGKSVETLFYQGPSTQRILTGAEFDGLAKVVADPSIAAATKGEEIRRTLELARIPDGLREPVKSLLLPLAVPATPSDLKFSVATVLVRYPDRDVVLAYLDLTNDEEVGRDILTKFDQTRGEGTIPGIMAYLASKYAGNDKGDFDHVDRLLTHLKCYQDSELYKALVSSGGGQQVLEFFFSKHDSALRARFKAQLPFKLRSASQIAADLMRSVPRKPRS